MKKFEIGRFQHSIQACHYCEIGLFVIGYGLGFRVLVLHFSVVESREKRVDLLVVAVLKASKPKLQSVCFCLFIKNKITVNTHPLGVCN